MPAKSRARIIAFYLPQYHAIPENDAWWGKGFTEWTNVAKARPLFRGHYQPHIPADLGFYDLRVPETRSAQAEMAKEHGIEGFCYWHYWFAGRRLLERPFAEVLASSQPDLPFCLAWANQSWTGVWHGAPDRVLIEQTYPGEDEHAAHFDCLLPAFRDSRYMTVDGQPIFVVYKPWHLPDPVAFCRQWRDLAAQAGLRGMYFIGMSHHASWNPIAHGFDAVTISAPTGMVGLSTGGLFTRVRHALLHTPTFGTAYAKLTGRPVDVYHYREAAKHFVVQSELDFPYHPCIIPNWDNTPRCGTKGVVLHNSNPELFRQLVRRAVGRVANMPPERRMVFVQAWNEWAEGNHLEPDLRHGKGYLLALRDEVVEGSELC